MSKSKDVAEKKSTAVGQVQDYGEFSGAGLEGVTADDLIIPFMTLLQALSPEVEDIDEAKSGMIFNKGTQELIPGEEGFAFLPVQWEVYYVEWVPRNKGGGLAGRHERNSDVVKAAQQAAIERGENPRFTKLYTGEPGESNELIETHYLMGFLIDRNEETKSWDINGRAMVGFSSTKIKACSQLLSTVSQLKGQPPLFVYPVRIKSFKDSNKHGEFYNFQIVPAIGNAPRDALLRPQENEADLDLMRQAHEFQKGIKSNKYEMGDEATAGGGAPTEEDVPF